MNNWKWAATYPHDETEYWRSTRQKGTFLLIIVLILIFAVGGFAPGVVIGTGLSIVSGVATFRNLIENTPRLRRFAQAGNARTGFLAVQTLVFALIVLLQALLAAEVGAWLASVVTPAALIIEWQIARELSDRSRPGAKSRLH